jgi:hypothetical protein
VVRNNQDFWSWFLQHEKSFYSIVKSGQDIENGFFNHLSQKLGELGEGYYFLTGMLDEETVELVLTADGVIERIVFVEELVDEAPVIPGWKFTASKPPVDVKGMAINLDDISVSQDSLSFYPNPHPDFPDEIDITIVCEGYTPENANKLATAIYIFLDNYLGELRSVTVIDNHSIVGLDQAKAERIPIEKLDEYLLWRENEFVEKYEGLRYNTEDDEYTQLRAELPDGKPLLFTINSTLLDWDRKASHPWIFTLEINYDGTSNEGLPDDDLYELMESVELEAEDYLPDFDGYLNLARKTGNGEREVYFACKDFRKPSKVADHLIRKYKGQLDITYSIYKDKYWQAFNRYRVV